MIVIVKKTFMKRYLIAAFLLISLWGQAQDYKQAVGLRGGLHSGFTYKNFFNNHTAVEGILHTRWHGWELVGLIEHHKPIVDVDNLYWFFGYGAHIGFYDAVYTGWDAQGTYTTLGVDGIIGVEYDIPGAPISIGLDWKPYINLIGYSHFFGDGGALSLRYTF